MNQKADLSLMTKINDICLFVPDLKKSARFYTEKMGFKVIREQPGYVEFDFQGTSLTLWEKSGVYQALKKEHLGGKGHPFMIAVKVPLLSDVDVIHRELIRKGVECLSPPETYPWGARAVYFSDPDSNIWEVFAWEKANGPGLIK